MAKFCRNCGKELDEGSVFCESCGTRFGESNPKSNTTSGSYNPFNTYGIDMIEGEAIIGKSEIHPGCMLAPAILMIVGFVFSTISFVNISLLSYYYSPGFLGYLMMVLFNPLFLIGLIWLVIRAIAYINTDLILTNKRVFGKCGLVSTTQMQCPLDKINSISFSNRIMGKLLGYGNVRIATGSTNFQFRFIRDGQKLYSDIFHNFEVAQKEKTYENAEAIADAIERRME